MVTIFQTNFFNDDGYDVNDDNKNNGTISKFKKSSNNANYNER